MCLNKLCECRKVIIIKKSLLWSAKRWISRKNERHFLNLFVLFSASYITFERLLTSINLRLSSDEIFIQFLYFSKGKRKIFHQEFLSAFVSFKCLTDVKVCKHSHSLSRLKKKLFLSKKLSLWYQNEILS